MNSIYVPTRRIRIRNAFLGVLALSLFVGSVAATGFFLGGGFETGVPVEAVFSRPGVGQQLPRGGDVKVRGVLVGRIDDITLADDGGGAIISMLLDEGVDLPETTSAEIRSKTVFGQKWVELIPPQNPLSDALLVADSVIPDERTREPLELERALQLGHDLLDELPLRDMSIVLNTLARGFSGQEDDAITAMEQGLIALRAVNDKSAEFDLALRQLREFSEFLNDNDETILSFMESLDAANSALVANKTEFKRSLNTVPHFLRKLSQYQRRIDPQLSRLAENGADLAEFFEPRTLQFVDLILQLQPFTTVWNTGLRRPCAGEFEGNLTCWQLYALPGHDSRGFYEPGESPFEDDPADPIGTNP
jgi:phospholipid/cholesterol/gamma-HCH transport system substrate-binding protein